MQKKELENNKSNTPLKISDNTSKEVDLDKKINFEGRFVESVGKRKTSIARVRLFSQNPKGILRINGLKISDYLPQHLTAIVTQPLKFLGLLKDFDISVLVNGGGKKSQSDAIRHAIAKGLVLIDQENKPKMKGKDWLTRDARIKERKKPGLKKARRAPQWSKR